MFTHEHSLALPVFPSSNLIEGRGRTLGQVLSDPVDQELLGRFSCPAASRVVKIANVLWLILFDDCRRKIKTLKLLVNT